MEWDYYVLEENHVFVSERHGESANDGGEDVEKLGRAVEFMCFVDQGVEAFVDCLSNHLSPWHQLLKTGRTKDDVNNLSLIDHAKYKNQSIFLQNKSKLTDTRKVHVASQCV